MRARRAEVPGQRAARSLLQNANSQLRFGLYNNGGSHSTSDGATTYSNDRGYRFSLNRTGGTGGFTRETGITWNNQPATGTILANFTITSADIGAEVAIDVTSYINAQRAADGTASFALVQPNNAEGLVKFKARERAAPPLVEIN